MEEKIIAILFASGDPLSCEKLFEVFGEFDIDEKVEKIQKRLDNVGLTIIKVKDKLQIVTKPEYTDVIKKSLEEVSEVRLSTASLEVLTIIAYNEPVTRVKVDNIRGIDSAHTVANLCARGFIEPCGRLEVIGRPNLYKTTEKFLKAFNLTNLKDLPEIEEFTKLTGES